MYTVYDITYIKYKSDLSYLYYIYLKCKNVTKISWTYYKCLTSDRVKFTYRQWIGDFFVFLML